MLAGEDVMKKGIIMILWLFCLTACQNQPQPSILIPTVAANGNEGMGLSSPGFENGQRIPDKYACENDQPGKSPEFLIKNVPSGTQSMALIVEDPDAPLGVFYHWVIYNIPPGLSDLPEGMPLMSHVAGIGTQGKNSFGSLGYGGPCPPFGQTHHYYFHIFALDLGLSSPEGLDASQLKTMIQGHILAQADWMGTYK
jgi:Raf kinase inhibitor-like YbhB/YbcL family protein